MKVVLFSHPKFMASYSMPRFATMIAAALHDCGHEVDVWSPRANFFEKLSATRLQKWGGYIDQYILFPCWVRAQLKLTPVNTLFVFADQALGPWVPMVKGRPHVVHAHDLLALRSALGEIPENPTSFTGKLYQRFIKNGFKSASVFIAISEKTKLDLIRYAAVPNSRVTVVHNDLNFNYTQTPIHTAVSILKDRMPFITENGIILHVGGDQWYKNRLGVISIYKAYANEVNSPLPLVLVGPELSPQQKNAADGMSENGQIHVVSGLDNESLQAAYSAAKVFLFPSLAEGFGWPILEAQACGALVITTDDAPMNEIGGSAPFYMPKLSSKDDITAWSKLGADTMQKIFAMETSAFNERVHAGKLWANRYAQGNALRRYIDIYRQTLQSQISPAGHSLVE